MTKTAQLKITAAIMLFLLSGCAAPLAGDKSVQALPRAEKTAVKPQSVYETTRPEKVAGETTTLECRAAHRLGCRYQGRIYPWNAWVEAMGYKTPQYAIADVVQSGNRAVVTLVSK